MKFTVEALPSSIAKTGELMFCKIGLKGNINNKNINRVEFLLNSLIKGGVKKVIFDIENLQFIDSIGIGKLISIIKTLRQVKGEAVFVRYTSHILNMVKPIDMENFVNFYPSIEEGISFLESK